MKHEIQPASIAAEELPALRADITYLIPVEDNDPFAASFLQGFAPSLLQHERIIHLINTLPSDLWELTPKGQEVRLARRMSGQASIRWFAQSPKALTARVTPIFVPFVVVFLGHNHDIRRYQKWIDSHAFPIVVVSEKGGVISYEEFNILSLRNRFLKICDALEGQVHPVALENARTLLNSWEEPEQRELGYQVGGHNSVLPNAAALQVAGYQDIIYGPFEKISDGIGPYVEQIYRTAKSIIEEREQIGERQANQYFRRPPSINLYAPAVYPHMLNPTMHGAPLSPEEKRRLLNVVRALNKQEGYMFQASTPAQISALYGSEPGGKPQPHFLMQERAAELSFGTECMGTLAASEFAAVLRLPNAINRTAGLVRQFAQQYHAHKSTDRKRADMFRRVQQAVTDAIPEEFIELIENSQEGIRLVCDAHLEWMKVRGLPLSLQKDTSRIPVTPGNLFVDQLSAKNYIHLKASDFSEILVLSALQDEDPISRFIGDALAVFAPHLAGRVNVKTVRVRNKADLISALNNFKGAMLVFDGHGGHAPEEAATLQLLEEQVNIWELQGEYPRVPPIVILSACDTHAADRNHASTANGFLSINTRTVLGSVFPIDARDAAAFVARLMFRVAEFVPKAHTLFNRSLTWMEIMGGMLRMQLLTDFCRRLESKGIIDRDAYIKVHTNGNLIINSGDEWPFERIIEELKEYGLDERLAWRELNAAAANSTAISYLQLGRPETIIVHPDERFPEETEQSNEVALLERS